MLTVEKITTTAELAKIEPVWNSLLAESPSNTLALTWEWISTWWSVFREDRDLNVLVVRDGDRAIAIAPLLKRTVEHYGLLPYRRLEFLGTGEDEADEICSEYLDFIILRGRETDALESIFHYLGEEDPGWDEMLLAGVPGQSPNMPIVEVLSGSCGMRGGVLAREVGIYMPLPERYEDFFTGLSASLRKEIRRDLRTAREDGMTFKVVSSAEGFEEAFELLIQLHQARWTTRGKPGVFASPRFTRFHRQVAALLLEKGALELVLLFVKGEPVAALQAFIYEGRLYLYQSGMSRAGSRLSSPGTLIRSLMVERSIERGLKEWDFLKTQPGSYKFRWSNQAREIVQFRVARSRSKEVFYNTATRIAGGLRQVKRALS